MTTPLITVEPRHLDRAACAIVDLLDRVDEHLAWAATNAIRHPDDGWNAEYRDRLAFDSLVLRLEFEQLCRERDGLAAAS